MAAATDSASHSLSHPPPLPSGITRNLSSSPTTTTTPWAHIVRGESEAAPSLSVNSDCSSTTMKPTSSSSSSPSSSEDSTESDITSSSNSVSAAKKNPAWNKPANGIIEEIGPVMGAVSWPALSDSTRPLPKSSVDTTRSLSTHQIASSPNKQAITSPTAAANPNPTPTPNNAFPVRHKSIKRGGGGSPTNAAVTQPPPAPSTVEMPPPPPPPQNDSVNPGATASHKTQNSDTEPKGGFSPRTHIANDHPRPRASSSSFRRANGGPHPNNYTGRPQRNFDGRDVHLQQQHHRPFPRSFMRHPPPSTGPYIAHPPPPPPPPLPVRPFGNPIGFHDMTAPVYYIRALHHEPLRGVPFIHAPPPPPPMFFPAPNPQLRASLLKQIDYYFSHDNLCKDIFLRQKMDDQGWVPVSLIANFNRVMQLTNNTQIILDAVRASTVVEVKGDKIRRCNDWMNWLLPPSTNRSTSVSAPESPHIGNDVLANHVQNVRLEERKDINQDVMPLANPLIAQVISKPSSGKWNSQSQTSNTKGTVQSVVREGSDQSMSARSSSEN